MNNIEQKVIKFIDRKNLINPGDKILVALSGGPDSVFMLYFLFKFKNRFKIDLAAFHLNHMLRGMEAANDSNFCGKICREFQIPFFSMKRNIKRFAKINGISTEEAGREVRYKLLEKTALKNDYNKIATAHNSDDNTETVLLNLIKGTGLKGLSGIPVSRGKIIRPILVLSKPEIVQYLKQNKIEYRIDSSNQSIDYERNYIRNELIPKIKDRLNPNLDETFLKSSEVIRNQYSVLEQLKFKLAENCTAFSPENLKIDLDKITDIPDGFRGELFKSILERNFKKQFGFNDIDKLVSLISAQRSKSIQLSNGLSAVKEKNELRIFKKRKEKFNPVAVKIGSSVKIGNMSLEIKPVKIMPSEFNNNKLTEFIDGGNLAEEFLVRRWKAGDRFFPIGLKGSKKISDFLNEKKISIIEKEKQLLLLNEDKIVWVIGQRLDDRFRIKNNTKRVIKLCLIP